MTSLFEVRSKTISADDLNFTFVNFINSARRLQAMKQPMRKAKQIESAWLLDPSEPVSTVALPKLVILELEIFGNSVERNTLQIQNYLCDAQFAKIFKAFHSKRKLFQQTCALKNVCREKCEAIQSEYTQIEWIN
jgi:hypothetical protein